MRSCVLRCLVLLGLLCPLLVGAATPAVVGGDAHSLALKADGTVLAWGYNEYGQLGDGTDIARNSPVAVPSLTGVVALAAGSKHSLALKADGTVLAWGWNVSGQLGDGTNIDRNSPVAVPSLTGVVALAAGSQHSLALKSDGTVLAWGNNGAGQLGDGTTTHRNSPVAVTGLTGVVAVVAGYYHNLALKADGTVVAWGANDYGQLGDGNTTAGRSTPMPVTGLTGVVALAAGTRHSLALKSDGTVMAWGFNNAGQLGDGTNTYWHLHPAAVTGLSGAVALAAGADHSLTLTSDGTVVAWGYNGNGQLGDGSTANSNTAVAVGGASRVLAVTAGANHSFALKTDGTVMAWGDNAGGKLGDGTNTERDSPVLVPGLNLGAATTPMVAAGDAHSLALKANGTVLAWGANASGQLGDGSTIDHNTPLAVNGLNGVVAVAAGNTHSLALKADGTVMAWGLNNFGQLGDGSTTNRSAPVAVYGLSGVVAVSAGNAHCLALKADGTVLAWGFNSVGQLGDGSTTNRSTPVPVVGLSGVVAVVAGYGHNLALKADGTVLAWGYNEYGQLGDGSTTDRNTPVVVNGLSGMAAVAAGYFHSLALKADGTVLAWGDNTYSQLGDGSTTSRSIPAAVNSLSGVVALKAGALHTLALKADGSMLAWGHNNFGQVGDGSTTNRNTPVVVNGLGGVVAAAAAGDHSLALKADGSMLAWGANYAGQLGDGSTASRSTPGGVMGGYVGNTTSATILSTANLNFATQPVGSSSASQTVTLTNTDSVDLHITMLEVSGDFSITRTCATTLAPGASCSVAVSFTPTTSGARSGSLAFGRNGVILTAVVLSGTGVVAPVVSLNPTSLSFASQNVGSTSSAQSVTLTNSGGATLNIASITASGDFAKTNASTCGATLAAAASCSISVTFTPTAAGARTGGVAISSDAAGSTHSVDLSGTGLAVPVPAVTLSPTALTFAARDVGSTSAVQTVTLSNTGNATLAIASITVSGDFAMTHNCGVSVTAAGFCTLSVTFTPTAVGLRSGGIIITSNASGGTHGVGLTGTGQAANQPVCSLTAAPPVIKKGASSVLSASCTNSPTSYVWSGGTCAGTTAATCTVTPTVSTSYSVTATNANGSGTASASVTLSSGDITPILFLLLFD